MPQHVGMDSERHLGSRPKPRHHPAKGNGGHWSAALAHEDISSGFLFANPFPYFAHSGGLVSYGTDRVEQYRGAASYVDRVLRGEKAGDLPFQQPTKYELVINLATAKTLGLTIPPPLLFTADEVIE